jgi:hypothetical protein
VLRKGPLKGKRVELAPTTGLKALETIAEAFMLEIFGFEPGEYLITDLSSLYDFVGVDDMDAGDMLARVSEEYGLDLADLPDGNLLEIFKRVHDQQIRVRKDVRAH